jgi:hypothetical protein
MSVFNDSESVQESNRNSIKHKTFMQWQVLRRFAHQAKMDTTQLPHRRRCLKTVWLWEMHFMVNEQINPARVTFQSANVIQQLQIEALRCELRLRGLFSVQPRPTSLAYESTLAVLLKQMSDESSAITTSSSGYHK